jgi:hypothetical protein
MPQRHIYYGPHSEKYTAKQCSVRIESRTHSLNGERADVRRRDITLRLDQASDVFLVWDVATFSQCHGYVD